MTTDPTPDFDGCNSECRKAGAHTLRWGGCEHAPKPEPTVSMSKIYTDPEDGYPSIGFDSYTVPELARLIEPAVGDPLRAAAAARAIVHRNDPDAAPAVTAPGQTLRDRVAEALISWTYRGKEPDPETGILETVRANAYSRADAVLAALFGPIPAATDTATWTAIRAIQLMSEAGRQRDAALSVPPPDGRPAAYRLAVDAIEHMQGYPRLVLPEEIVAELRRMAAGDPHRADRAAVSATLWAAAEHHTVAEWICCEPIDPAHDLCTQGGAALRLLKALLVDDPDASKRAPLLDQVMGLLTGTAAGERDEQQGDGAGPEEALDLSDGPVRCPLRPCPVTLHTPSGARAHFTAVHPEQRVTGRDLGPWPLLVTGGAEAGQEPDTEAWDVPDARPGTTDHTLAQRQAGGGQPSAGVGEETREEIECANCWRVVENRSVPNMGGPSRDNWVHVPGGFQHCFPQRGADSPRAEPELTVVPQPETVHGCPPDGSGITPCCGRTPFELPRTDRMSTSSEAPATCKGAGA